MHYAAWNGHLPVVVYLLSVGADTDIVNNDGKTALQLAEKIRSWDTDEQKKDKPIIATVLKEAKSSLEKLSRAIAVRHLFSRAAELRSLGGEMEEVEACLLRVGWHTFNDLCEIEFALDKGFESLRQVQTLSK